MKFVVSSIELLNRLQSVGRVIASKNSLPILDTFLFKLNGNDLEITASDLETTLVTKMVLQNAAESGIISIPSKLLLDTLKEFPNQPLTFDINTETYAIVITTENGQFTITGHNGEDFPKTPELSAGQTQEVRISSEALERGISTTIFAVAEDEMRPVMNGIFFNFASQNLTFASSDSHKLITYKRLDYTFEDKNAFILPKKPANLLKGLLAKTEGDVIIGYSPKNALFTLPEFTLICRLVEGVYPNYATVIPTENPNKMIIDRVKLMNTLRRVSVFSNPANNLIKLHLSGNQITVSAQDIDYSISAFERLPCQYDGDELEVGYKSSFLIEMLTNLYTPDVVMTFSVPSRPGLVMPLDPNNTADDTVMLIMPVSVKA